MPHRLLASLIIGGSLIAALAPAHAYVRTKTCDPAGLDGPYCAAEQLPIPVRWRDPCITYLVNARGSDDFPRLVDQIKPQLDDTLRRAILGSAEAWNREQCTAVSLVYGGITCSDEASNIPTQVRARNINLIVFREDVWDYPSDAIAITTLSADPRSGEILDADIEFNGVDYTFEDIAAPGSTSMDLRNTLTHEFGHFIGLAHEPDLPDATMFPNADPGETFKRDLEEDDVIGMCEIYPLLESTPLACLPVLPQQDETCAVVLDGQTACAAAPQRAPSGALWPLLLALLGATLRRQRR